MQYFGKWIFLFFVFQAVVFGNSPEDNQLLIQNALQEINETVLSSKTTRLDLLANVPQVIPTLAQWLYDEWHPYDVSLTQKKLINAFSLRLNRNAIPITFVLLKGSQPIGTISLKQQTAPEFSDFPEESIWMGGLQVISEERNQGFGKELLRFVILIAKKMKYQNLYFFTSKPTKVPWYLKQGAQIVEKRPFRNHTITILSIPLL